jgi:hypothetical protein
VAEVVEVERRGDPRDSGPSPSGAGEELIDYSAGRERGLVRRDEKCEVIRGGWGGRKCERR